jgi:hypothetical protein
MKWRPGGSYEIPLLWIWRSDQPIEQLDAVVDREQRNNDPRRLSMQQTRMSTSYVLGSLSLKRTHLERLLRDYAREVREAEILMCCRVLDVGALGALREILPCGAEVQK